MGNIIKIDLGDVLKLMKKNEKSLVCYKKILELDP